MTPAEKMAQRLEATTVDCDGVRLARIPTPTDLDAAALIRRLATALVDLAGPKREHYKCEDGFYSCPKHPKYFGNDDREHCNCGADEYNAKLERHADALRDAKEQA